MMTRKCEFHGRDEETAPSTSYTNGSQYGKHPRLHYQPRAGLRPSGAGFTLTETSVSDRTIKRPSADKVGTPTYRLITPDFVKLQI